MSDPARSAPRWFVALMALAATLAIAFLVASAAGAGASSTARWTLFGLGAVAFVGFVVTAGIAARWLTRGPTPGTEARAPRTANTGEEDPEVIRRRAQLVSTIAHELKGPLMSIKGLAATGRRLYDSMSDEERKDFFRLIDEESGRLKVIAEETSTVLKLDAGVITYQPRAEDLSAIVEEVAWRAAMGDHPMTVDVRSGVSAHVDRARIVEVLEHGLDNAAKYSPPDAPVAVRLDVQGRRAVVEIEDRGPGLEPDQRERAFERYANVRPAGYEEVPGAGLGLFISRAHVLAHGGRISLLDGTAGGTILRIELPTEG